MPDHKTIPFDKESGSIRYTRTSFESGGLDTYSSPPAQDPDNFEVLNNVMPTSSGNLMRRWGYSFYLTPDNLASTGRLYEYQSDVTGNRRILAVGLSAGGDPTIQVITETPGNLVRAYTTTAATTTNLFRIVNSRDYAYATAGVSGTQIKWTDTSVADDSTKWGIDLPGATSTAAIFPGTGADGTS